MVTGQIPDHIAHQVGVSAVIGLDHLVVFAVNGYHHTIDPGVVLIQLPVLGNEELGDLQGTDAHHGIEQMLAFGEQCAALLLTKVQELVFGIVRKIIGPRKGPDQRFIRQVCLADGLVRQGCIQRKSGGDLVCQGGNIAGNIVQRILIEQPAVAHLDHKAALGIPAGVDTGGVAVYPDGAGLHIHAQDACIFVAFPQPGDQFFGSLPPGVQEFRKTHLCIPSFLV